MRNPGFLFDLHCHTPFSDSQWGFDEMIKAIINLNIKVVGFADHVFPGAMYKHPPSIGPFMGLRNCYNAETLRYRKGYIKYLNRKYPQITFLNGGEIDVLPQGTITLPRGIDSNFFLDAGSYLMVVKHHTVPKPFTFLYKKRPEIEKWMWVNNPRWKLNARLYEKGTLACFQRIQPEIFAHPQENVPRYQSDAFIKRLMMYCAKYNVAFELNHYTRKEVYDPRFLEFGVKYGVEFSVGSDFHGFGTKILEDKFNEGLEMFDLAKDYSANLLNPMKFLKDRTRMH